MVSTNKKKVNKNNYYKGDNRVNTMECGKKRKREYFSKETDPRSLSFSTSSIDSGKHKYSINTFVKKNDTEESFKKLNPVTVKNQKDGFKYIGFRCRVAVSMNKIKKSVNLHSSLNWVEGIIKYWDPKFKLFFIHFLLAPSINSYDSTIPVNQWKHLVTQFNSPPAELLINDLKLSPYALDRGWFSANPSTLKYYADGPLITLSTPKTIKKVESNSQKIFICCKCNIEIIDNSFVSCSTCNDKYHNQCITINENSIEDLKDSMKCIRRYCNLSEYKLIEIAKSHFAYLKELKKTFNRSPSNSFLKPPNITNTKETQISFDLANIKEIERTISSEVKNIIMENYNLPQTSVRKLLSKLPNKIGMTIDNKQLELLCRKYKYYKKDYSKFTTDSTIKENLNLEKVHTEAKICSNDNSFDEENILKKTYETEFRCRDCMICIYCNNSLLNDIPILLKPNELPNRSILYTQIPSKMQDFVVCTVCGICFHGCCANSFIPPLLLGGNYFKCSNCCACIHCGYRDEGFIDCTSWDSTFTTCIRCYRGFEKGQYCFICKKVWSSSWEGQWLKCDICSFWVHYSCDEEIEKSMEHYSKNNNIYNCPVCRSHDNKIKLQRILDNITFLDKNKDFSLIPPPAYQNYWKVVKIPMDIVTIQRKLDNNHYEIDEFLFMEDIYRMIYNAQISHMPNHRIYKLSLNILKKTNRLYKLLFGEDSFLKNVSAKHYPTMLALKEIVTEYSNNNMSHIKKNTLNSFGSDDNCIGTKLNRNIIDFIRKNIIEDFFFLFSDDEISFNNFKIKQIFKINSSEELNNMLIDLTACFNNTFFTNNIACKKCGGKIDGINIANKNQCDSCTRCSYCKHFMNTQFIPLVSCSVCNKRIHYSCLWNEPSKINNKSLECNNTRKNMISKVHRINDKSIDDNEDFICSWRLYSSFVSPNKSTALINSPLTAIFGKGYYQYIAGDIYICDECEYKVNENIFIKEHLKLHNASEKHIMNVQNLLKNIMSQNENSKLNSFSEKIMRILISTNLRDNCIDPNYGNIIICNICSKIFYCKDFIDLKVIAFEKELCTSSFNFTCFTCKDIIFGTGNVCDYTFPPILNTLISTSQFRIRFSKDIHRIAKIILDSIFSSVVKSTVKFSSSKLDIEKLRSEIIKNYLESRDSITNLDNVNRSSLVQWYLYYIQQNDFLNFYRITEEYLECFYKQQIVTGLKELINKNTLSLIVYSIEKMVLLNKNETENHKNDINNSRFFSKLNSYLKTIIGYNKFKDGSNTNILSYQAFIDVKTFTDIEDSLTNFYLTHNSTNKCNEYSKEHRLKNEIVHGLSLMINQIIMEHNDNSSNSIFTVLYSLFLSHFKKEPISMDICHYCGNESNILFGNLITNTKISNIKIHKECILWSLPFTLEPILNNIGMGYESKFDVKKKNRIYIPKFSTFGKVSWPLIMNPIIVDINDVIITINDMNVLKCELCSNFGATIKCSGNDTCPKYYHLDCLFNHNFKHELSNNKTCSLINCESSEISENKNYHIHIRIKYRRVWCENCWPIYKKIIEPRTDITEGLTGGILNNFSKLLSIDVRFVEPEILITSPIVKSEKITYDILKKTIKRLKKIDHNINSINKFISFLKKLKDYNIVKEPFILNNSFVILNSGEITSERNIIHYDNGEVLFIPDNYSSLRIWRNRTIFNDLFSICHDFTIFHCSINNYSPSTSIEFQIDWVPDQKFKNNIIQHLKLKNEYNKDEMHFCIRLDSKDIFFFRIPLLRDKNIEKLYTNFLKLIRVNNSNIKEIDCLICPKSLFCSNDFTEKQATRKDVISNDTHYHSQLFFGLKEELVYRNLKSKMYEFYFNKFISMIYYSNFATDVLHPWIWTSHRHYKFELKTQNDITFYYPLLGRSESKRSEIISKDDFMIISDNENVDLENSEIINISFNHYTQDNRRKRLKVEDMTPSMLYRYLESFPYDKRLEIRKSNIHGYGLFAKESINPGEPIIEYVGELIRNSIADKRESLYKSEENRDGSCYMFRLDETHVIDATNIGNHARFMNHCCDPNSLCKIINIDSDNKHIVVFSKKLIEKDEEITYDYQFNVEEASEKISCHCGANNCLGRMN
ncbi:multidomain chromatinic protein with the following architecture [Cryptosporidium ryanae]|uniref:multidomain chromatinic protein with the following architecture n=1 Tax=Cryptosporidium ryanae TaxID=515981 RepID=UPI00351A3DC6|nr:multidomain chromatinic protein with the following architecture [Cryptosporidium ryanae]